METPEFEELVEKLKSLDMKMAKLHIYSRALEFAILYHCSGQRVPDDIAEITPKYARYLNNAAGPVTTDDDLLNILSQDIADFKKDN